MNIEANKVVSVNFKLSTVDPDNGEEFLVEETGNGEPLVFLFGKGELIEKFEKELAGQTTGFKFDFTVSADDAFGEYDEEKVAEIPTAAFADEDGNLDKEVIIEGNSLPMVDDNGNHLEGEILEITDEFIVMDFNHPLAGETLHFEGVVLNVRDASADEIAHGHVHGAGGHHH